MVPRQTRAAGDTAVNSQPIQTCDAGRPIRGPRGCHQQYGTVVYKPVMPKPAGFAHARLHERPTSAATAVLETRASHHCCCGCWPCSCASCCMIMGTHFSRQDGSWRLQRGTSSLHGQDTHVSTGQQTLGGLSRKFPVQCGLVAAAGRCDLTDDHAHTCPQTAKAECNRHRAQ